MTTSSLRFSRLLALSSLALLLQACPRPPGSDDSGVVPCAGQVGCECVAGNCTTGECIGNTCVDCRRGEASCVCRTNNTCNTGLRCTGGACETCPAGQTGCPCSPGDTCGAGLTCAAGTCVADTCVAGTSSCPCRATDPKCDDTQYCDGTSRCQACSNDIVGCPCVGGACAGATVCEPGVNLCRAPVTCATLQQNGTCLPNQACTTPNGGDATCTAMTCNPQFKWNGTACVACLSLDCAMEPTCAAGDGGLGDTCAAQNRACSTIGATAACGACLAGFTLNGTNQCVPVPRCGASTCALTEFCDTTGTPTCVALPCPAGQAQGATNVCSACTRSCTGAGLSGRIWPFRAGDDSCVCETLDNYYFSLGNNGEATLCDADNDGWVREEADVVRADVRALRPNARCSFRAADRVRLVDESGMSIDVLSCTTGLVKTSMALPDGGLPNGGIGMLADGGLMALPDGGAACPAFDPLKLLETQRNDIPLRPMGTPAPQYGSGVDAGRLLEAAELNSLTKACVSTAADYNDNLVDDISETQTNPRTGGGVTANRSKLETFAYFVELDSANFSNGVLIIQERSRCSGTDLPLRYFNVDGGTALDPWQTNLDGGAASPYWRTCTRSRDTNYDLANPQPGFDFAQYSCDDTAAGCNIIPPPHPGLVAPVDPGLVLMRNHGVCDLKGGPPADGRWRGMNHHSQFKCVSVVPNVAATYERVQTDFSPTDGGTGFTFNQCAAATCPTPGDPSCSKPQGAGPQTRQPVVNCRPAPGVVGSVGFASVNFRTGISYSSGCVNEDTFFQTYLCPSPEFSLNASLLPSTWGRYSCYGRGSNFLWAGPQPSGRSTLRWGANANSSVLR